MGVHVVHKRMASGERRAYHYAWRGGPRIASEPGTHAYLVEFTRLTRGRTESHKAGMFPELVDMYQKSALYTKLKGHTKRSYDAAIDLIESEFCDLPVSAIDQRGARSVFLEWRDQFADTPRKADMLITILARILSVAADREIIARNPIERPGRLSKGTRRELIWADKEVEAFKAHASPSLCLAMDLARLTGQRQGDLLRMTWSAYDGTNIELRQRKTGMLVRFEALPDLRDILDSQKRKAVTILTTERGNRPWTESGFRASWRKAAERAGIDGKTFHDLRGTYVTTAYKAGVPIKDIADITGHTERSAESIIRKHYLAGRGVVEKLAKRNK